MVVPGGGGESQENVIQEKGLGRVQKGKVEPLNHNKITTNRMYHQAKKCKNCVLNGDCLIEDPEDCDCEEEES